MLVTDAFGGFGGIAKFNRDLLTALCSYPGAEIIALPRLVNGKPGILPAGLIFDKSGVGGKFLYVFACFSASRRHDIFDLVICGHINLLPIARLCQKVAGGKLGLIVHGIEAWQPTGSSLANRFAQSLDFFISVSDFTRQKFCKWSGLDADKGFILPNCIDLEVFTPGPKNPELLARYGLVGRKVILTVGRMSAGEQYKGFDEILEVLPDLARENPEIAYLVVGDGDDRARLEHKAKSLGLSERVVFAGQIGEAEKVDHYRLADVFAMPGRGEGFGIVYLEALACGVPVIASSMDGSQEIVVEKDFGAVVDPEGVDQLRNRLIEYLKQKHTVTSPLEYFSRACFKSRVMDIVNALMGRHEI